MGKETLVTSLDVARLAGVSQSAVSRVFTPGASVSKKTAEKVRKAADELGYRRNNLARSLITGQSRIIGLVVGYLNNQFYPDALEKLSNALQKRGYHVLVFMAENRDEDVSSVLEEILDYQVDGIVMASVAMSSQLAERCEAAGTPVVLFNRSQDDDRLSAVTSDNFAGGRRLAEFLCAGGHHRIAHIAGWEQASTQRDREAGFMVGLKAGGQTLFAREVGNYSIETAKEATRRLFQIKPYPDALFVANDHMAFAVLEVLRLELGLSIPEDVSVVGYDDVPLSAWPSFDLTTIRQPLNRMVAETINILMSYITDQDYQPQRIAIDGPLILRKSARIPEDWNK